MLPLIETLSYRRSGRPKYMNNPGPTAQDRRTLEKLLSSVPSHTEEKSYSWVWIRNPQTLADIFVHELAHNASENEIEHAREKAFKAPQTLALVIQKNADDETKLSAGASLMQLLNGLHLLGYSAKTVSAKPLLKPNPLCHRDEQVLVYILVGSPAKPQKTIRLVPFPFRRV